VQNAYFRPLNKGSTDSCRFAAKYCITTSVNSRRPCCKIYFLAIVVSFVLAAYAWSFLTISAPILLRFGK